MLQTVPMAVVEAAFKADCAERGESLFDANAKANVVPEPAPTIGQCSDSISHFQRHAYRLEWRVRNGDRIVEDHHHTIPRIALKRCAVFDDDLADCSMVVTEQ